MKKCQNSKCSKLKIKIHMIQDGVERRCESNAGKALYAFFPYNNNNFDCLGMFCLDYLPLA